MTDPGIKEYESGTTVIGGEKVKIYTPIKADTDIDGNTRLRRKKLSNREKKHKKGVKDTRKWMQKVRGF